MDEATVLITGARGGIGRALARRLSASGWRIAAVGRDASLLEDLPALRITADTTSADGAAQAIEACIQAWGSPPTHLAHCVGSTLIAPLHRASFEQLDDVLRVNLLSALLMLKAWAQALKGAQGCGAAVFVSSVAARIGIANHEGIAAAKGGIEALVRAAAASYAPAGLRINAVAPGLTETPLTAGLLKMPVMREAAERQYPLGGIQQADDVAATIAWLLGPDAARVTGTVVEVDGGFSHVRPIVR